MPDPNSPEFFYPPCVQGLRLLDPMARDEHNPGHHDLAVKGRTLWGLCYIGNGDGTITVSCDGRAHNNGVTTRHPRCSGGETIVPASDIADPNLPLTAQAIASMCTAQEFMACQNGIFARVPNPNIADK